MGSLQNNKSFRDESTECAVCLEPFKVEGKGSSQKPIITLRCGHKWHLECIIQQLEVGSMTALNDDQRLMFSGCQCAKCGSIFGEDDHPDLPKDLIRSTDKLRSKVYELVDNLRLQPSVKRTFQDKEAMYKEVLRKHAFYLCAHCQNPYHGGTIDCADNAAAPTPTTEAKLCPACAPQSQAVCQNPSEHGPYLQWKCRYCCRPSTHVCYGNVHFCDECHQKNSIATRCLPAGTKRRPSLSPIPCPGDDSCKHPKPNGTSSHSNGHTQESEQVYSCALCDSIPSSARFDSEIPKGSRNLVVNPSGQQGLLGWRKLSAMSWTVEEREEGDNIPPLQPTGSQSDDHTEPITTNFVSSYRNCCMGQNIDLGSLLRIGSQRVQHEDSSEPPMVRVEVSAKYTGRTDCPSIFCLQAFLGTPHTPLQQRQRFSTRVLEAPPGSYWERAALTIDLGTIHEIEEEGRPTFLTIVVIGKDQRFWRGNFGSKVADICVRVLGDTRDEINALLLTSEEIAQNRRDIGSRGRQPTNETPEIPRTDADNLAEHHSTPRISNSPQNSMWYVVASMFAIAFILWGSNNG